jgi:hypothetical protein
MFIRTISRPYLQFTFCRLFTNRRMPSHPDGGRPAPPPCHIPPFKGRQKDSQTKVRLDRLNGASGSDGATRHGVRQPAVRAASQFSERLCFGSHEDGRMVHRSSWFNRKSLKNNIFFKRAQDRMGD